MRVFTAAAVVLWSIAAVAWAQVGEPSVAANGDGASSPSSSTAGSPGGVPSAAAPASSASGDSRASIEQAFESADLAGKLSILQSEGSKPSLSMGPLYQKAVDYLTSNLSVLHSEPKAQELAVLASRLVGSSDYTDAAESMWQLFQLSDADPVRLAAANALAVVAKGNGDVINKMNHWLAGQNLLHMTGASVDPRVIDGCVRTLAALEDPSSFQVLFATMEAGYGEPTTNDAKNAIHLLKGDRVKQFLEVVSSARYSVRTAALQMAVDDAKLSTAEKARVAVAALESGLSPAGAGQGDASTIAQLRYTAVASLARFQWTPAAGLIMTNFNRAAAEYQSGTIPPNDVVVSVNALAAMSTHEAAVRLSLYLGLINSMTEKGRHFDRQIILAVVQGIGQLGDSAAFDNLSAMQYLDYPQSVKDAAAKAVSDLTSS